MKKVHFSIILSIAIAAVMPGVFAGDVQPEQRVSNALDALLLATEHVYVSTDHNVQGVFLNEVGAIFMGEIAMTSTGGWRNRIPAGYKVYMTDGSGEELKTEDVEEIKRTLSELEVDLLGISKDMEKLSEDLSVYVLELDKELESTDSPDVELPDLSALESLKSLKKLKVLKNLHLTGIGDKSFAWVDQLNEEAEKRLAEMDQHVTMFKGEVIDLLLKNWKEFETLKSSDNIVVIFKVKEPEFAEKYGTDKMIFRVKNAKLQKAGPKHLADITDFMDEVNTNL